MKLKISTFNVCGLKDEFKRETLVKDFIKTKLDILQLAQDRKV